MSYVGYIPLVKQFIHDVVPRDRAPALLEVGVDRGTTLIPLVAYLARARPGFVVVGIDIMVQESVKLMLLNMDLQQNQLAYLIEENSLSVLPKLIEQQARFDVVLLDGDHNYHTVSQEMQCLESLTHSHSLVVIDDYDGRWAEKDLWYAERDGYQDVKVATPRVETEKHGVKAAVDEWLEAHPEWQKAQPIPGEPIILMKKAS